MLYVESLGELINVGLPFHHHHPGQSVRRLNTPSTLLLGLVMMYSQLKILSYKNKLFSKLSLQ